MSKPERASTTTVDRSYLFTDVEGSTSRWEQDPATTALDIEAHDRIMRDTIEEFDGHVFSKGGDSFGGAFQLPSQAATAALAIQQRLAEATWRGTPIRVRIGLHRGESSHRDDNYFGVPLNRAARIADSGHGGQVVVSEAMRHLIHGFSLAPLGTYRLKDLSTPVELWQLDPEGATPGTFPPLRTMDGVASNLPSALTDFVGREHELLLTTTALKTNAITTMTGVGGTGKTRLAIQAAAEIAHEFPDGIWFVDFLAANDFEEVIAQTASALGAIEHGANPLDALARRVTGEDCLVILDNCEHVLDAAGKVALALVAGATCTVLATSREPLRIPGEAIRPIAPLDAGDEGAEALQLFIERARLVDPEFHADEARMSTMLEICQALDGLPLAIELAAARTRTMSLDEIRERLSERFRLLRRGRRDDGRQASLRSTIEWSFEQLDDEAQEIACRSSVFSNRFGFDELATICGPDFDEYDLLDIVEDLVDKSLLVADTSAAEAEYRHLESIRAFLREELGDEAARWQQAHLAHFADWIGDVVANVHGADERTALALLEQRWPEIRACVHTALELRDIPSLAKLMGPLALDVFWRARPEVVTWSADALRLAGEAAEPELDDHFAIALCAAAATWMTGATAAAEAIATAHELLPHLAPNACGIELLIAPTAALVSGAGAAVAQDFIDCIDSWTWSEADRTRTNIHLGIAQVYLGQGEAAAARYSSLPADMRGQSSTWSGYRAVLRAFVSGDEWTNVLVDLGESFREARDVANPLLMGNIANAAFDGTSRVAPSAEAFDILATSMETTLETRNPLLEVALTGRVALLANDLSGPKAAAPLLIWSSGSVLHANRQLNTPLWAAIDQQVAELDPAVREHAVATASSWTRQQAITCAACTLREAADDLRAAEALG